MDSEMGANNVVCASNQLPTVPLLPAPKIDESTDSVKSKIRRNPLLDKTLTMSPEERPRTNTFHWEWLWS
jgi:hypothetical protein